MESIADNLARKQERALYLTTPDGVKQTPSDMNKGELKKNLTECEFYENFVSASTSVKKQKLEYNSSDIPVRNETVPLSSVVEPKASTSKTLTHVSEEKSEEAFEVEKSSELSSLEPKETEIIEDDLNVIETEDETLSTELLSESATVPTDIVKYKAVIAKPVSRPLATVAPQKSLNNAQFKHKLQLNWNRPTKVEGQKAPVFSFAAKSALAALKEGKDALVQPVNLANKMHNVTHGATKSNVTAMELPQTSRTAMKVKPNREEQHKHMYKANKMCNNGRKNEGMLKGVRLNKRFELQMAYRNMKK